MEFFFISDVSEQEIAKEKAKARELRKKQWWKSLVNKGVCYYCGGTFPAAEITMDHVVPLARGGKSTKGNIVAACKKCNSAKKYMLPTEWQEYLQNIAKKDE
ncbi:MAG: HNH endonuclease [Deferribacterales bacterium]|nr:HNH endonuclease [Deferribacterales bacterium]